MSTKSLRVSDDFSLPLDAVTQTFAILAKRGVGKSYLASVTAEEMLGAGQQIVVIDPTGAWYGLRSSADGKGEGVPILVAGGERGDIPLDEHAGELLAQAIVERRFSAVIDLSLFRKGQVRRFLTPFLETLYRLNREALHLFVDEADDVCPQKPFGDEAQMVGAMEDVVKRGRRKGIGCTLITQRPADLAKQVLTQCEVLVAMRLVHPRDIAAIKEWVNVHAEPAKAAEMIAGLPSLPVGTAWFWSPGWGDFFRQVKVRRRQTFDSSATPKAGQTRREPKALAPVDVQQLGAAIAGLKEQAKANDPAELRRRIAELEKRVAAKPPAAPPEKVEVPVLGEHHVRRLEEVAVQLQAEGTRMVETGEKMLAEAAAVRQTITSATARLAGQAAPRVAVPARPVAAVTPRPAPASRVAGRAGQGGGGDAGAGLSKAERLILTALAQNGPSTKNKVAVISGYAVSGGGFNNALSRCRSQGWVEGSGDRLQITDAGAAALGDWAPLPAGAELIEHWKRQLGRAEAMVLDVLVANPGGLTKEEVATAAGYAADGGGFNNALSRLRTLELIEGRGELRLTAELAEAV